MDSLDDEQADPLATVEGALRSAVSSGVPVEALAVAGRWWELESWLRTLAYLELRSAFGAEWLDELKDTAVKRSRVDEAFDYMPTPDGSNPIHFVDVGVLFDIIKAQWWMFEETLLPSEITWDGRVSELKRVRNRVAHCRRPHFDDRSRIEQLLRDLEPGARRAVNAYKARWTPPPDLDDPVVRDWVGKQHEAASRLIEHGEQNYGIHFRLGYAVRPWARRPPKGQAISGTQGVLWTWRAVLSDRWLDLADYWECSYVKEVESSVVFVTAHSPTSLEVSFPAVDDPAAVSDAIAGTFEGVFLESHPLGVDEYETVVARHLRYAADADSRVLVDHALATVDDTAPRLTFFDA